MGISWSSSWRGLKFDFFGGVEACDALDGEDYQTLIWK